MLIQGGHKLMGRIQIMGSKNAAGPLIAASLLMRGKVILRNVPRITDLFCLIEILEGMGVKITWLDEHSLQIDSKKLDVDGLDRKKMKSMRFSILLLGPLLARAKRVVVPEPGGCKIGNRPIDTHLYALSALGASTVTQEDRSILMEASRLVGTEVILPEFSVTATENLIMAAVTAKGKTNIRLAAAEPHVQDLCRFLIAAGAKIDGVGTHELTIQGVRQLSAPPEWTVIPDMIEVGTFAVAAALTRGTLTLSPVRHEHLDAVYSAFDRIGVKYERHRDTLTITGGGLLKATHIQALIYPGLPTDLQAIFGLLATQCQGTSLIHDPLFESRMGYIAELSKMGANASVPDPHRALIHGPTSLRGTEIRSLDLRAGATMLLAGLIAEGETVIHDAEIVYRGYERLDERLRAVGADIVCIE